MNEDLPKEPNHLDGLIKILRDGREAENLSDPQRLHLLQEGILAELLQDGSDLAVRTLAEIVIDHPLPQISQLAWEFLQILGERLNLAAQDEICCLFIEHDHSEAGVFALDKGYLPQDSCDRAMFFLLTEQSDSFKGFDPDLSLLTEAYRQADAALRKRASAAALKTGFEEWETVVRAIVDDEEKAWPVLLARLPLFRSDPVRRLALQGLDDLAREGHGQALRTIFSLFIDQDYSPARDLALSKGYLPTEPEMRTLFYLLTGQWERYEQVDFNQSYLSSIYENASQALRRRMIAGVRRSGRLDWLQILAGGRRVRWLGDMTESDWEAVYNLLVREGKTAELWRLAQAATPIWSAAMLLELNRSGWQPSGPEERSGFERLVSLAARCSGKPVNLPRPQALKGVYRNLNCLTLSPDGKRLACGLAEGSVQVWQLPELFPRQVIPSPAGQAWTLGFSSNGDYLAGGYGDHSVRIWRFEDFRLAKTLDGHQGTVRSLAVSSDGRQMISGGFDGQVKVWRFPYGPELRSYQDHTGEVFTVQTSPDGRFYASGGADSSICIWSSETGALVRKWAAHSSTVTALAFSFEAGILASGGRDQAVHLWAVPEGSLMKTIRGHKSLVSSLAIQPDGRILASAGLDGQISLWSLPEGQPILTIQAHSESIAGLSFFPDGERIVSAGAEGSVLIWNLKPLLYLRLPVERVSLTDIHRIQGILEDEPLSETDRSWFEFALALIQWRHRFDIALMEPHHIQVGDYDIELG